MPEAAIGASPAEFAAALTEARMRSGLTVRAVAKSTGLPVSTLGGYFSGRHLPPPSRPQVLESVLDALSVPDPERPAWHEALRRLARQGRASTAASPYPGLRAFTTDEARDFHGRDELVEQLRALVLASTGEFVVLVGASGTGKSSLLQAGLAPALADWETRVCAPGDDPGTSLEPTLAELAEAPRACVVLDQANDLWVGAEDARDTVLASLQRWVVGDENHSRVVVLGLRSDFYAAAAADPILLPALRDRSLLVGPMGTDELAKAITLPARRAGRELEPGLVDLLVAECETRDRSGRTPALPHLSHCLATMWAAAAQPGRLTTADYRATGGIAGAVARTAEAAYAELDESERAAARRLLLRLVLVEEDLPPTAATIPVHDVSTGERGLLEHFAAHRLITIREDTARLSHEAVIDSWPRLREWVRDSETMLLRHRLVTRETTAWVASDQDPDLLLRGSRLASAEELLEAGSPVGLTADEVAFIEAGSALERDRVKAAASRQRRQRLLLVTTSVLMVLAMVATLAYVRLNGVLTIERDTALSRGLAVTARSLTEHDPAVAHQVAVAAYQTRETLEARSALVDSTAEPVVTRLLGPTGDRRVAAAPSRHLLAVAGGMPTVDLYDTTGTVPRKVATVDAPVRSAPGSAIFAVAFSPDGGTLALGGDGATVRLYDVADAAHPRRLGEDLATKGTVYAVQFVGDRLYAATAQGGVARWRIPPGAGAPAPLASLPTTSVPLALSVADDGRVVVGTDTGEVLLWSRPDAAPAVTVSSGSVPLSSVHLEADGTILAGSHDGTLTRFGPTAGGRAQPEVMTTFDSWVNAIARSGDVLVAGSSDALLHLWRGPSDRRGITLGLRAAIDTVAVLDPHRLAVGLSGGEVDIVDLHRLLLWSGDGGVFSVGFAQQGSRLLATTSRIDSWSLYDTSDLNAVTRIGSPVPGGLPESALNGTSAISPDGELVAVGHRNGTIDGYRPEGAGVRRVFRIADHSAMPEILTISRDGSTLAVGSDEKVVRLYDLTTTPPTALAPLHGPTNFVLGVAFSPDRSLLAAASVDGNTYLWRRTPAQTWTMVATLHGTGYAEACAFSPDGRVLASAGADGVVHLWDVADPTSARETGTAHGPSGDVFQLAFSSNGDLAAAAADETVTVWRPETGADGTQYVKRLELTALGQSGYSISWASDGRTLAAGGAGGALRIWDTDPAQAVRDLCGAVATSVTSAEWTRLSPGQPTPRTC